MPRKESLYPRDWLRIAEKDLGRAQHLLDFGDPEAAGFYLQQAVEKLLKAFLLFKGWSLKRIHDLEVLLNDALTYDPSLEEFRSLCQKVTAFYLVQRYPLSVEPSITQDDVQQSLSQTERLVRKL